LIYRLSVVSDFCLSVIYLQLY